MRRKILIVLLAFGTVAGYAAGFRSMRHCNSGNWGRDARGFDRPDPYAAGFAAGYSKCNEARDK